jgi:hypothetical protein
VKSVGIQYFRKYSSASECVPVRRRTLVTGVPAVEGVLAGVRCAIRRGPIGA